ncbi:transcriptional repressor LexA [Mangrovicoccus algicola]|uniref:LexA repressor n=1 Tax=Mangrovicoccus algicola TaxID=2771008 RepID=A0A8J6Z781_9RHOB|nr:transcriptional repressor LexA [Mangrovicoccus algicola]MBE3639219.1 transcriptional repressor LexA [Mangrovicoccus algicola]
MLTKKMLELLEFIHERQSRDGVPPSFDEMKDHLGLRSKSGIHRLITSMEERGYLRRLPHKARAIEILRLPDTLANPGFAPRVIEGSRGGEAPAGAIAVDHGGAWDIPLQGRIAAGGPIEAVRQEESVTVPGSMLSRGGNHYALEVQGDSMIDIGINDGDIVVIREGSSAENGEIVVAKIDDETVTLKRYRRRGRTIALEPANAAHVVQTYSEDRVQIQGRLVGLIRTY